jgi:hypothetical protein
MAKFTTIEAAFQHVSDKRKLDLACGDQQSLWTILVGWSGTHYVYFSDRNHGQQMHNIGKTILEYSGNYGVNQPDGRDLAKHLGDFFKVKADEAELVRFGGHSEESMIRDFANVLTNEGNRETEIRKMHIINSDSPCTTEDRGGSNNLQGWPASCMTKLVTLAQRNPTIEFSVSYKRRYGKLDEGAKKFRSKAETELGKRAPKGDLEVRTEKLRNDAVADHLSGVMQATGGGEEGGQGRITISPFDPKLTLISNEYPNI